MANMKTQYAVIFDLDIDCLNDYCEGKSYIEALRETRDFMISNGFSWTQGSVYFGDQTMDAVKCILAIQALAEKLPWFSACVKDIRMLRIEENDDLLPAIR